jgi:hypothetical protein
MTTEKTITSSRHIPDGYSFKHGVTQDPTQGYCKDVDSPSGTRFIAFFFLGLSFKPTYHYSFKSNEDRDTFVNQKISTYLERKQQTKTRRANSNQPSELVVGDILYTSWGYEQTNVEFFQVVKTSGIRTVELMRINSRMVDSLSDYTDDLMPIKDSFITEGYRSQENGTYRVKNGNIVSFNTYKNGYKWDGKPKNQTASGYGH